jgi:hypothetical protein
MGRAQWVSVIGVVDRVIDGLESAGTDGHADQSATTLTVNDIVVGSPIHPARTITTAASSLAELMSRANGFWHDRCLPAPSAALTTSGCAQGSTADVDG